jgi:hypothetical protein
MHPGVIGTIAIALLLTIGSGAPANAQPARSQSAMVCDGYARNYAQKNSAKGQMLIGGGVGSLVGAGLGAIGGAAGVGAAIGGGIGLIGGGARRKQTSDQMYAAAYRDCMAGHVR